MFCKYCGVQCDDPEGICSKCRDEKSITCDNKCENELYSNTNGIDTVIKKNVNKKKIIIGAYTLGIIAIAVIVYLYIVSGSNNVKIISYNTENFPEVSLEVNVNGNIKEQSDIKGFTIEEDGKKTNVRWEAINLNRYKVKYVTNYKEYSEKAIGFQLTCKIKDKDYYFKGHYMSPKLPDVKTEIKNVVVDNYPEISFDFKVVDTTGILDNKEKEIKVDKIEVNENGEKILVSCCEKISQNTFNIKYTTKSTARGRKEIPFRVKGFIYDKNFSVVGGFIPPALDNLSVDIRQVDCNAYPKIKLYCSIKDSNNDSIPENLSKDFFYINEKVLGSEKKIKNEISKVTQLNGKENLNINIVADTSGSMNDYDMIGQAKNIINNFCSSVQFNVGDKIELLSFNNSVYEEVAFTGDKSEIANASMNLYADGSTCFYDALYVALNRTASQQGAKCIIAFTDGLDNVSSNTAESVIELSKKYRIPIFIVGIRNELQASELQQICDESGGFYTNIDEICNLEEIYNSIYTEQKEMYMIEYITKECENMYDERNINLQYQSDDYGMEIEYTYRPEIVLDINSEISEDYEVDSAMGNYLRCFVKAINANDFTYLQDTLEEGSPLYKEQQKYIATKKAQEELISYEITDKKMISDSLCQLTVREVYQIENYEEPLHIRTFDDKYTLRKQRDGKWLLISMDDLKLISKTAN